ncbi:MAG: exodeoxyribonuclease VII small subunit [Candidatus Latescibacterota bacterium]|nr:MAG: exodeoxyribonuclease VII small subunit [Candidatus Latescibacterota bacterium]
MTKKKERFEDSMKKLEAIVDELEKGDFSLEESIGKFEEGLKLGKLCRELLEKAEKRIKLLSEEEGNTVKEEDAPDDLETQ